MFSLLINSALSVSYSLAATKLTISGSGVIDQDGVRSKGSYDTITDVIIEEGPSRISDKSFENCFKLSYIYIPISVESIGEYAFRFCRSLTKIVVHEDNQYLRNDSQYILYSKNWEILYRVPIKKGLNIHDGVKEIASNVFTAGEFGDIVIPSSVETIHTLAFDSGYFGSISFGTNSKLTQFNGFKWTVVDSITIPNSVTSIAGNSFGGATIRILNFEENSNLKTLDVNAMALLYTNEINLPESLEKICDNAFSESSATKISIGSKCSNISVDAFIGCKNLQQIVIDKSNNFYVFIDDVLMNNEETEIIFFPYNKETIEIKSTVTKIGATALQSGSKLTSIQFENDQSSVWSTVDGVLYSKNYDKLIAVCGGITSATIDGRVTSIGDSAAYGCMNLKSITFQGSLIETIGEKAFHSSGIESFDLPSSVKTINNEAFRNTKSLINFHVSEDSLLETISNSLCFHESAIKSFYFGQHVTYIGLQSFQNCQNLETITFHPNINIKNFNDLSFGYTNIKELLLPASLTSVVQRCFINCHSLTKLHFKENSALESIDYAAFSFCDNLSEVILPDSCKTIGVDSFCECTRLVSFKHNLGTINSNSFKGCTSLENFNFSARQTQDKLDPSAFLNCHQLTSFSVDISNVDVMSDMGYVFKPGKTVLILFPPGQETAIIPTETQAFADNAFAFSSKLKFVAFYSGSNLEIIGNSAFYECKKLEAVRFPPKMTEIRANAFFGCESLMSVSFPDSLKTINENAFIGCKRIKVNYCGTNFIDGQNVFDKNVEIYVTDLYKEKTFCSNVAAKKLAFNCELKPEFIKMSCKVNNLRNLNLFSIFSMLMIISGN